MLRATRFDSHGNHKENTDRLYIDGIGKEIYYRYQWITNYINNPRDTGYNLQGK